MKAVIILFICLTSVYGQLNEKLASPILYEKNKTKVMSLGVFHFAYPGKDGHKTKKEDKVDVLSEKRQGEIRNLVDKLKEFNPNKVLIEWKTKSQGYTDSVYREYLDGKHRDKRNEVYQLAFRLASELGHDKVYCTDAEGRSFQVSEERKKEIYEKYKVWEKENKDKLARKNWNARYKKYYSSGDKFKLNHTITESLIHFNDPYVIREHHGHYLVDDFDFEEKEFDGIAIDGFISYWYNRNLKIFRNIKRYAIGEERVLLIYGYGHMAILNHLIESYPEFKLVRPSEYLK